jgi:CHAD domain-containing protein
VRRIARSQASRAIDVLTPPPSPDDLTHAVHDVRKRCKKVRGVLRLVRPALGEQAFGNADETFRDAARTLSGSRDAHVLLATIDTVTAEAPDLITPDRVRSIRDELAEQAAVATTALIDDSDAIDEARRLLDRGRSQIDDWSLDASGWSAFGPGIEMTYSRGIEALAAVRKQPTPDRFHELRKRAKYSWYQIRLITPCAPSLLKPLAREFDDLSERLGDAHDLAILRARLDADPDAFGGDALVRDVGIVADGLRERLERDSVTQARRLFAEKPKHYARRLGRYWQIWEHESEDTAESRGRGGDR